MSRAPLRLAYGVSMVLLTVFLGYVLYVLFNHFALGGKLAHRVDLVDGHRHDFRDGPIDLARGFRRVSGAHS